MGGFIPTRLMSLGGVDGGSPVSGSGSAGQVAYWSSSSAITGSSALTFSGGVLAVGGKVTITPGTGVTALELVGPSLAGSAGNIIHSQSGVYSWLVAPGYNTTNVYEITPSTAVGGSTFSNPGLRIDNNSKVTLSYSGSLQTHVVNGQLSIVTGAGEALTVSKSANDPSIKFETSNSGDFVMAIDPGTTSWNLVNNGGTTILNIDQNGKHIIGTGTSQTHRLNTTVQSTVGAAGGASALPATPDGYVLISINGTNQAMPYYAAA